jgi:hypothetical protein
MASVAALRLTSAPLPWTEHEDVNNTVKSGRLRGFVVMNVDVLDVDYYHWWLVAGLTSERVLGGGAWWLTIWCRNVECILE